MIRGKTVPRLPRKLPQYVFPTLTSSQQHDIKVAILKAKDYQSYTWYQLAINGARRASEIASVKWSDIHDDMILQMPSGLRYFAIDFFSKKFNETKRVWVSIAFWPVIQDWKNRNPENKTFVFFKNRRHVTDAEIEAFTLSMNIKMMKYVRAFTCRSTEDVQKIVSQRPHMLLRRTAIKNMFCETKLEDAAFLLNLPKEILAL